ncbi:unnamed protein product [Rangifer tarandus platyrhynchus]|uniref:Secreted protein n=1 Tax=Rangifer tarandus platyrhynchus TaxID=3082113 RepID=A0ABN9A4E8_RANTA|nr:unnamed protein product [Rangifer tarandus platyrhynchus]
MLSHFSSVQLCAALWTIACQVPLSIGCPRQEYWSKLPCPLPEDLPNLGIKPASLVSPALAGRFFTISTTWEAPWFYHNLTNISTPNPSQLQPILHIAPLFFLLPKVSSNSQKTTGSYFNIPACSSGSSPNFSHPKFPP